ncbi:MAG: heme ABC exporter ATP-binding protein CcmA [Burkholderiaceae bacterium]
MTGAPEANPEAGAPADGLTVQALSCAAGARPLFGGQSFAVAPGRWTMLTGRNGSGKTTMMRAIAGLVRPLDGTVLWQGRPQRLRDAGWRRVFYYEGHAGAIKPEFSAIENLATQAALDHGRAPDASTLAGVLERVGLARVRHVAGARLSAGQVRRLNLARLLCGPRPLWLLDEPANALDAQGLALLADLLDAHLAGGGCALIASHQPLPTRHPPQRHELRG